MPINRLSCGQSVGQSSRLTSSTISSSAKCKTETNQLLNNNRNDVIMKTTTNLTRTRSLRLPSRSRDHNYLMSGQLINNSNDTNNKKSSSLTRHTSIRTSSDSSSSQQSTIEMSVNNVTTRSRKTLSHAIAIKDALIPKFVKNTFTKSNKNLGPIHAFDDNHIDKYQKRNSPEDYKDMRREGSMISNSFNDNYFKANNEMRASLNECPASPMSNSSRDSGIIGYNGNNNKMAQNYLNHLRKLTEEHERLQIEYSRVRLQLIETTATIATNKGLNISQEIPQNVENELQKERSLAKSYKSEVIRLQEELKRLQRKYWDNIIYRKVFNNSNNNIMSANGSDVDLNLSNSQNISEENDDQRNSNLVEKIESFQSKIKELENETKEAKESIEFLTSERSILVEALKEAEENLLKERLVWIKEKEAFEEVRTWSKCVYEKLKEKSEKLKELESNLSEKDVKIKDLLENQNVRENISQNLSQLLNNIRESVISVLTTYQNENAITLSKLWPQFDTSVITNSDQIKFDHNIINEILSNNFKETEELKRKINEITKENMDSKRDLNNFDTLLKEKNTLLDQFKVENESFQKKLMILNKELDLMTEKYRCSESVNKELKTMTEESNRDSLSSQNVSSLRLEIVSLKESIAMKEDMIEKLSSKYARNRKVWEENDRKATQEIKKLDDIVDHVIESLKSLPENLKNSDHIQEILELLTEGIVTEQK